VNRLWVRLTLAFVLVVMVTVVAIAALLLQTTTSQFRQYITNSSMQGSGSGLQKLVAYYEQGDTWSGVEKLLAEATFVADPAGNSRVVPGRQPRLSAVLADGRGKVVFDGTGGSAGLRLTRREKSQALEITSSDGEEVIGYLLLSIPGTLDRLGGLEQRFLRNVRNVLYLGAGVAVLVGLILAVLLSTGLAAPLQRLAAASRAVANRDFSRRVPVEGSAEMVNVAEAFNDMTEALEQSERQRQNMVADVAHELRTPLTVLQGNLRAILDDVYALDKEEIARLYDETRLLGRLVDDLRELALADSGELRLHKRFTDVGQVVHQTVESLTPVAETHEIALASNVLDNLPAVQADPDRVAQVLRNLLVNALRHTPAGGSVTVAAVQKGGAIEVSVVDTGEGIEPEDLPHVFERFWQAEQARTRRRDGLGPDLVAGPVRGASRGTGLGLSVAQSLIEAHGGRIWAESMVGIGSTFRFTIPIEESFI
jgi:two-component system OmpR family sensor kinase/two-component system sensor histidine kinase BaeS